VFDNSKDYKNLLVFRKMKSPVASSLSRSQSYLQKKEWNIKKIFSRVKHTSLLGENVNDAAEIIY